MSPRSSWRPSPAQRRSGTFPDNADASCAARLRARSRSTKVGDVPRQRLPDRLLRRRARGRSTKVGDVPRQRPATYLVLPLARASAQRRSGTFPDNAPPGHSDIPEVERRSTKVGDVPRQRRGATVGRPSASTSAQRRSGTFPDNARGRRRGRGCRSRALNEGRGRSPTTPLIAGMGPACHGTAQRRSGTFPDNASRAWGCADSRVWPLNEGRGRSPTTPWCRPRAVERTHARSTKVGDVPRQRPGLSPGR